MWQLTNQPPPCAGSYLPLEGANARAMHRLLAAEEHKSFRGRVWDHYSTVVGGGAGLDILNHPSYDPPCPSHCSWMPHIPDVGTYAYEDIYKYMNTAMATAKSKGLNTCSQLVTSRHFPGQSFPKGETHYGGKCTPSSPASGILQSTHSWQSIPFSGAHFYAGLQKRGIVIFA